MQALQIYYFMMKEFDKCQFTGKISQKHTDVYPRTQLHVHAELMQVGKLAWPSLNANCMSSNIRQDFRNHFMSL